MGDRLIEAGEELICLNNTFTGPKTTIVQSIRDPGFELTRHVVTELIQLELDRAWHLTCPGHFAS